MATKKTNRKQYKRLPCASSIDAHSFWEKVSIGKANQCWPWNLFTDKDGYGKVHIRHFPSICLAHRIAYLLATKRDPYRSLVLHKCIGSPSCCNPSHLYLGTDADNVRDMIQQNRQGRGHGDSFGEKNTMAKLTDRKVLRIRSLYANGGITMKAIGKRYHISQPNTWRIIRRERWKHVE